MYITAWKSLGEYQFFVTPAGVDGNNLVVPESNGDGGLGPESGEIWPAELDPVVENSPSLTVEEKSRVVAADQEKDIDLVEERLVEERLVEERLVEERLVEERLVEERLVEDCLDEQPLEDKLNCEQLSPQSELDDSDDDPAMLETIFIAPLDGSQAELRTRVIKEVRKPGRSE